MNGSEETHQGEKQAKVAENREMMIAKWRSDMRQIDNAVVNLYHGRSVYKRLFAIVGANPRIQKGNPLYEWLQKVYAVDASTAIRRLMDEGRHNDVISLASLVRKMKAHEDVITREWFVSQCSCPHSRPGEWDRLFDELVGEGRNTIDGEALGKRVCEIKRVSKPVLEYVDKLVAHHDKKPPSKLPTWSELDGVIDAVGELFDHMCLLINQHGAGDLRLTEAFRWEQLFEEPWIVGNYPWRAGEKVGGQVADTSCDGREDEVD